MYTLRLTSRILALITLATVFCSPVAKAEPQPRMEAALADLRAAREKLEHAPADKGGHREKAIALIDEAIAQVKEGVRFDNHH